MNIRTVPFDLKQYINELAGLPINQQYDATRKDPSCNTPEYQERLDAEVNRLLREPTELMDVETDELVAIYIKHDKNLLDLGENVHRYFVGLAQEQAKEHIE